MSSLSIRRRWAATLLVAIGLLGACNQQGTSRTGTDTSPSPTKGREVSPAPESGKKEIEDKFAIPVPDGYEVTKFSEFSSNATVEMSYQGAPQVADYRSRMEAKGWELTEPEPINSFKWKADLLNVSFPYVVIVYLQTQMVRAELFEGSKDRDARYDSID